MTTEYRLRAAYRVLLVLGIGLLSTFSFANDAKRDNSFFKIGVKGGMSFSSISYVNIGDISPIMSGHSGFNAGVSFQMRLPIKGLALQPEILYVSKGAAFGGDIDLDVKMGYIEVPLNIQYGVDLILFKPFIEISPFIGYAVSSSWKSESLAKYVTCRDINRLEYGIGVGGGIDFWRCQLKVKYNWNLGKLTEIKAPSGAVDQSLELFIGQINKANFKGLEVSLAFFF